jgi:hypothetical protein
LVVSSAHLAQKYSEILEIAKHLLGIQSIGTELRLILSDLRVECERLNNLFKKNVGQLKGVGFDFILLSRL